MCSLKFKSKYNICKNGDGESNKSSHNHSYSEQDLNRPAPADERN